MTWLRPHLRLRARSSVWAAVAVVATVLATLLLLEVRREVGDPGNSDYIAFATGARLVLSNPQHMYLPPLQTAVESQQLGIPASTGFIAPFTNLPAGALLLSPLAHLDLHTGAAVAAAISLMLFGIAAVLSLRLLGNAVPPPMRVLIVVASVFSIPALDAVVQWDSLLTVAVLASLLLVQRKQYFLAGLVLATLTLKPQTVWLVVPALVAAQSWRYLGGLALGAAAWVAASMLIAGPASLFALGQLMGHQYYVGQASQSIGIPSVVAALGSGTAAFVLAAMLGVLATALLFLARRRLRGRPLTAVALAVPLSLLCAPHVSPQDLMLVTPTIVLIGRRRPVLAAGETLAFSVVALVQQAVWVPARQLQPFVLAVVAATAWLTVRQNDPVSTEGAEPLSVRPYPALAATHRTDVAAGQAPRAL